MKIYNKIESIEKIKELKLNRFQEELFRKNEQEKVIDFLKATKAKYYAIRDKSKANGIFKLKVEFEKVLEEIKEYDIFTLNVSSANYTDNQLLVGEVEFFSNNNVYITLTDDKEASVRDALRKPVYNLKTDIFDKKLNEIPHFDEIYDYISKNELFDVIVELAVFNIPVGINNERIIIYELRTHY